MATTTTAAATIKREFQYNNAHILTNTHTHEEEEEAADKEKPQYILYINKE